MYWPLIFVLVCALSGCGRLQIVHKSKPVPPEVSECEDGWHAMLFPNDEHYCVPDDPLMGTDPDDHNHYPACSWQQDMPCINVTSLPHVVRRVPYT